MVADLDQKLLRRFASGESIMPMSGDEWRRLRELEAQLAGHRRLAALARRLESASVDRGPRQISVFWVVAGGVMGFTLVAVSAVAHSNVLVAAGVIVLAATLVVVGQCPWWWRRPGTGASSARLTADDPRISSVRRAFRGRMRTLRGPAPDLSLAGSVQEALEPAHVAVWIRAAAVND